MKIRHANQHDLEQLLSWKNDPISLAMSINSSKVSKKEHEIWFRDSLKNPLKKMYIGSLEGNNIGSCYFNLDPNTKNALISITLDPLRRGKNLSYKFLQACLKEYLEETECDIIAIIKINNLASIKLFEKSNFSLIKKDINLLTYKFLSSSKPY